MSDNDQQQADQNGQGLTDEKLDTVSLRELHERENPIDLEELEKTHPHIVDEMSAAGSLPNPEIVTSITTKERAERMGTVDDEQAEPDGQTENGHQGPE